MSESSQLDQKKSIYAWAFYDWANSAFATTVIAGFFPLFFAAYWADPLDPTGSTYWLGVANSLEAIIVAILAPILGAIADKMSGKKRLLALFAFLGILMTGCLYLVAQGQWILAVLFYVIGNVGFSGGNIFYDALLTGVASEKKIDYVSSLGFSLGYIGGGLLFVINVVMFLMPDLFGISDSASAIKLSFLTVAIWWTVFSIPIFLIVKEPPAQVNMTIKRAVSEGFTQLKTTFKKIRQLKYAWLFLLAYWFYIDGVDTIIRMAVDFGTKLGFDSSSLIIALLLVQFVAFPGTLLYHKYASKVGTKKAVLTAIIAYGIITIFGAFMANETHFFILAITVGLFQGGIQALSRSLYSRLIPTEQSGEFYGFFNMWGKFAAIIGPFLMGLITVLTGEIRWGIISILALFIIGGLLLSRVNVAEAEKSAQLFNQVQS